MVNNFSFWDSFLGSTSTKQWEMGCLAQGHNHRAPGEDRTHHLAIKNLLFVLTLRFNL